MPDYFFSKDKDSLEEFCPSLTLKQKLIGFGICIVIGIVLEIIAWLSFHKLVEGDPKIFAVCFSLGILVTLLGSAFLVGFAKQVKTMFKKKRVITTCVVVVSFIMTLVSALIIQSSPLTLLFMIIELLSYTWYVLSYLPFAQTLTKKLFSRCFGI
jgi:Got1/Sft2-like family